MMVHVEYMGKAHNVAFCAGVDPMKMLKLLRVSEKCGVRKFMRRRLGRIHLFVSNFRPYLS